MNDIESDLCSLPTGVNTLEFMPRHGIDVWEGVQPFAKTGFRWYGIRAYKDSLTYELSSERNEHGVSNRVTISCLVVRDSQELAQQLDEMQLMRFVLRLTHYDDKRRIIGTSQQFCELTSTEYEAPEIVGAQGYRLTFTGVFDKRPAVVVG